MQKKAHSLIYFATSSWHTFCVQPLGCFSKTNSKRKMNMKHFAIALLGSIAFLGCDKPNSAVDDRSMKGVTTTSVVDRDNSAVNTRDRDTNAKTPFDQNENKSDIGITASIRRSVIDTKMSTIAHNIKIITQDGTVTLRGPVMNEEEKSRIEEIARNVAGVKAVDSQLEIK